MAAEYQPVQYVRIRYICDDCGAGEMLRHGGAALLSDPPQFPHRCSICSAKRTFSVAYPTTGYLPEDQAPWFQMKERDIEAAITAFLAAARERGLKLVGRETTFEMDYAAEDHLAHGSDHPETIWQKMFDAAPEVKP